MIYRMFRRKSKLKQTFDEALRALMNDTREEWDQAKLIESHLVEHDQVIDIQRKIAESKHFYLYKEAKARKLGRD